MSHNNTLVLNEKCNLNLVSVPLPDGIDECELEDLFDEKTLATKIKGRSFSRKDIDKDQYYNKDIFSRYVYNHYKSINFSGFKPLLDIISKLVDTKR